MLWEMKKMGRKVVVRLEVERPSKRSTGGNQTHTVPILELGMMNLMVTARDPGTEETSKGSSLIRRTMRPKAWRRKEGGNEKMNVSDRFRSRRERAHGLNVGSSGKARSRRYDGREMGRAEVMLTLETASRAPET